MLAGMHHPSPGTVVIDHALDRGLTRTGPSRIAGTGLFARRPIVRGMRIIEYAGRRRALLDVIAEEADRPPNPYLLRLDEETVIDGAVEGSDARFANHSCEPNCAALTMNARVYLYASRDIPAGEELTLDYQMRSAIDVAWSASELAYYACNCGTPSCRGTRLAAEQASSDQPPHGAPEERS